MLIYSMGVSVDGYIADREGAFDWTAPSEELFRFHLALVSELGGYLCGRRLYETMLVWETDPSMRETEDGDAFADVCRRSPKTSRWTDRDQDVRLARDLRALRQRPGGAAALGDPGGAHALGQHPAQLVARADAELREHLAQVVGDRVLADE
jgi:dihydrofolate reductase